MFVPLWFLLLTGVALIAVAAFTLLVLRRALNELFFWRSAYVHTIDRVEALIREEIRTRVKPAAQAKQKTYALANGEEVDEDRPTLAPDRSMAAPTLGVRYCEVVESVSREASKRKIEWPSNADRDHYKQLIDD